MSSPEVVSRVVPAVARLAVQSSGLQESLAAVVLTAVDGGAPLDRQVRDLLQQLHAESDHKYLEAQDALGPREAPSADMLREFRRARALAALLAAVDCRDGHQATEVVYEALASSEDEAAASESIAAAV